MHQADYPEEMLGFINNLEAMYDDDKANFYLFDVAHMQLICCKHNKAAKALVKTLNQPWQH